jgi:hypothetical protein
LMSMCTVMTAASSVVWKPSNYASGPGCEKEPMDISRREPTVFASGSGAMPCPTDGLHVPTVPSGPVFRRGK